MRPVDSRTHEVVADHLAAVLLGDLPVGVVPDDALDCALAARCAEAGYRLGLRVARGLE